MDKEFIEAVKAANQPLNSRTPPPPPNPDHSATIAAAKELSTAADKFPKRLSFTPEQWVLREDAVRHEMCSPGLEFPLMQRLDQLGFFTHKPGEDRYDRLAALLGVKWQTVERWATTGKMPQHVAAYIQLAEEYRTFRAQAWEKLQQENPGA